MLITYTSFGMLQTCKNNASVSVISKYKRKQMSSNTSEAQILTRNSILQNPKF